MQSQAETFGRSLFAAQVSDYSISDQQFVTNLYESFLQRGPDAGGLGFWTSVAGGGSQNRQNVLNAFATCGSFYALADTLYREEFWLVNDRLGTPRMIVDKSGSIAGVRRHDYLPFGEELYAGTGGRTTGQGYTGDSTRQKFTGYEADAETGLNFAQARYQSSAQGRFTSVDPTGRSASVGNPQSFNRYSYVQNNPTNFTDPTGLMMYDASMGWGDVAGLWEGGGDSSFGGPFETGRDIINNDMNGFADRVNEGSASAAEAPHDADDVGHSDDKGEGGGEHSGSDMTSDGGVHDPQDPQNGGPRLGRPGADAVAQSATGGRNRTTIITWSDGTEEIRQGGDPAWRNNNPGNIRPGRDPLQGDIGSANGFVVFSSVAAGDAAIVELLNRPYYQNRTVGGAIAEWAPARDRNNPVAYAEFVQRVTGLSVDTRMNTLAAPQIRSIADAIRSMERANPGTVTYRRP